VVYDEELKLAGSIDMIFENPDGTLQIYDWKRVKEIKYDHDTHFGNENYGKIDCIRHLPDTNYWHYSLQLNTYKKIIETKYDKKVTDLYLVCLHPDNPINTYDRIKINILEKEMDALFELRRENIKSL
jgi:ATP-dependent exoDNAse (exonuclease V) beta subunit